MNVDLSAYAVVPGPADTTRLIPSRFPPIATFETVTSPEDLEDVFELEGWTNDRLSATRIAQLDPQEWVYGRANASIVMAAFLHAAPTGQRFSGPELGAWYAASALVTAILEVANGLRREIALSGLVRITGAYRAYKARLAGGYVDIVGGHREYHDPDAAGYPVSQAFGRAVRDDGPALGLSGIRYESVRHPGHDNWVCFRPRHVEDVVQAGHYELDVPPTGKVVVRTLP